MIAAEVGPEGSAGDACGYADGAAGFDEEDGETGAGGDAAFEGFERALVGFLAFGGVLDVDLREELLVEGVGGFGGGFGAHDERGSDVADLAAAVVAAFVEGGVGEDIVEEDVFGDVSGPWGDGHGGVGIGDVAEEEVGLEGGEVRGRHVVDEELHGVALGFGDLAEGAGEFRGVRAGGGEGGGGGGGPPVGGGCGRGGEGEGGEEREGEEGFHGFERG